MARTAGGDTTAFETIVRRHQGPLLRFAAALAGDRDTAADIVQEAFVALWRMRDRYRPSGSLKAYLYRLVRNACIDQSRSAWARRVPLDDCAPATFDPQVGVRLADALRAALGSLPEGQRTVFLLSAQEGLSYQEIADVVGRPLGTVASRKAAAVDTLRARLGPWLRGEDDEL